MQFTRKLSPSILTVSALVLLVLLSSTFVSMIFMHKAAYAQSSNTNAGFGDTTNLSLPNGKSIPIKYMINTGKLLGVVLDKSRATLIATILSPSSSSASSAGAINNNNNGNLTIQIPRDVLDNKKEGNADAPFRVHVHGKDATFKETDNNKTIRTLSIQFGKYAKVIDIIDSKSTVQ